MAGVFITFEGGEGSGKTTIASLVKDVKNTNMDKKTEALLYAASRRQHLVEKVIPALNQGAIVICDRFIDSSLVYQGLARGIDIDEVYEMNLFATENILPERTIFFDIQPELGMQRIAMNKDREVNRLDMENMDFHYKVYQGYLQICDKYPKRIVKVDASQSIENVFDQVIGKIREVL